FFVDLAQRALPLWRELEDDAGERLLTTTGGVDHGPAASVGLAADALGASGAAYELLDSPAAVERWPGMRFGESVLFQPDAGRVDADATVRALQQGSAARGADVHFGEGVEAMTTTGDGMVVRTGAGEC